MLVLSRKRSQSLYIGGDIKITVVKIEGNQVRLGIEAPAGVGILREELVLDVDAAGRAAHAPSTARRQEFAGAR